MVILGGHKHIPIKLSDFGGPCLSMGLHVLSHGRWKGFIQKLQVIICDVYQIVLSIVAFLSSVKDLLCNRCAIPSGACVANSKWISQITITQLSYWLNM